MRVPTSPPAHHCGSAATDATPEQGMDAPVEPGSVSIEPLPVSSAIPISLQEAVPVVTLETTLSSDSSPAEVIGQTAAHASESFVTTESLR